jgi:hypothetical protein
MQIIKKILLYRELQTILGFQVILLYTKIFPGHKDFLNFICSKTYLELLVY